MNFDPYRRRERPRASAREETASRQPTKQSTMRHGTSAAGIGDTDGWLRGRGSPYSAAHIVKKK